jgi:predicted amidohydrolase
VTYAEEIKKWQSQAVSSDSNFVQHFRKLSKELNIAISLTYLEKHKNVARNSVSLIDRKGQIQFTYAKIHTCDF